MLETLIALIAARSALELYTDVELAAYRLNVPSLFGLAMLALAAWLVIARRRTLQWHPLLFGWAAWLATLLPSVALALSLHGAQGFLAVREWIRLLSIPGVFLVAYNCPIGRRGRSGIELLFLVLVVPLLAAIVQMATGAGAYDSDGSHRVMGTLFHANSLAMFLVFFVGLSYWKLTGGGGWPWLILIAIELVVFVATLSLGGILMLVVLGAWIFFLEGTRGRVRVVALGAFLALVLAADGPARTKLRTMQSFAPQSVRESVQGNYVDSVGWRFKNWSQLISAWRQRPLFGWGLNASQVVNPETATGVGFAPHNDLLRSLVETGVFGLSAYVAFVGFCLYEMLRAAWPRAAVSLAWILTGIFLASQGASLGDNVAANSAFQVCLWSAWGFALSRSPQNSTG